MTRVGEFLAAAAILGAPIYGSWLFYAVTGHVLRF